MGHSEFYICDVDDLVNDATQACLLKNPLKASIKNIELSLEKIDD